MFTQRQANDLLADLLEESGYEATQTTSRVVEIIIEACNARAWPIESEELELIQHGLRSRTVPVACALFDDLATETFYGFNLRAILVEATAAERAALRTLVDRAKASRSIPAGLCGSGECDHGSVEVSRSPSPRERDSFRAGPGAHTFQPKEA